jgi:hypothetical protein
MTPRRSLPAVTLLLVASPLFAAPGAEEPAPAVFGTKPTAPVEIVFEQAQEPMVGQPLRIALTITPELELSGAMLMLGVDDPLALIEPAAETALGTIQPDLPVTIVVTVLPLAAETQYLRVAVSGAIGGEPQLRTLSVPIRFGTATPDKDDAALPMSPADALRSLEAVETVY